MDPANIFCVGNNVLKRGSEPAAAPPAAAAAAGGGAAAMDAAAVAAMTVKALKEALGGRGLALGGKKAELAARLAAALAAEAP